MSPEIPKRALAKIREIATSFSHGEAELEDRRILMDEVQFHAQTLREAYTDRWKSSYPPSQGATEEYFEEKLGALVNYTLVAIDAAKRDPALIDDVLERHRHFEALVTEMSIGVRNT